MTGYASADRLSRHTETDRRAVQPDHAALEEIAFQYAGGDLHHLCPTRPNQAEQARHLTCEDR